MAAKGRLSRRSFLQNVTGSAVLGGAVLSGPASGQAYTGLTDSDYGAQADRAGYGRQAPSGHASGLTDNDSGATADPVGRGRGARSAQPARNDAARQAEAARIAEENRRIEMENRRIRDMQAERDRLEGEMQAIAGPPQGGVKPNR